MLPLLLLKIIDEGFYCRLCQYSHEELEGISHLRMIFNTAVSKINPLGYLLRLFNRICQMLNKEGGRGLVSHIKDRLGGRVRLFVIAFLIILPALLALFFIKKYAANVSMWDDLQFVPLFDKLYTGHLSFGDLFAPWGEHRSFFPYLLKLLLGVITHYNTIVECYFSLFLLCLIGCVFFISHIRAFGTAVMALASFIPITWLIFNLGQADNFLWGFQIQFFVLILFFVLAIYLLATSSSLSWRFALSVASGVVCTFSMGNGLLVWPIGLIVMLWIRRSQPKDVRRSYLKMTGIWCLIGIVAIMAYFIGYHDPNQHLKMQYLIQHPWPTLQYFLAALGSLTDVGTLSNTPTYQITAVATGLLLFFLYIYTGVTIVRQTKARPYAALSLSLILFTLLSFGLMTVSRSLVGVTDAVASRHTTMTILGMVGLYMALISSEAKRVNVKPFLLGFLTSLIILGIALSSYSGIKEGPLWRQYANWGAYVLSTYKVQSDDNMHGLFPWDSHTAREAAEVLEKYRLNVFSRPSLKLEELTKVEGNTQFHIDTINYRQLSQQASNIINISQQEETLTIVGWAIDQEAKNTAGGVFISIDGQIDIPALSWGDRPDIADRFGESRYRFSGFMASFATSVVGEGQHVISLKIVTADKKGYYEPDQNILIEVK